MPETETTADKAVFENGDNGRNRRDTTTSSTSEEWKTKAANDLLVDLLDPVRTRFLNDWLFSVSQKSKHF